MSPFEIPVTLAPSERVTTGLAPSVVDLETHLAPRVSNDKRGSVTMPCVFDATGERTDHHVVHMTALVVDADHLTAETYNQTLDRAEANGKACLVYETWSHNPPTDYRLRLWYPFATSIELAGVDWPATWAALHKHLGHETSGDPRCRNASHIYYDARYPAGQTRDYTIYDGPALDPTPLIVRGRSSPPPKMPPPVPAGHGIPIDRAELAARLIAGTANPELKIHALRVSRGEAIGAHGSGRRSIYQRLLMALAGVLAHDEATEDVCEALLRASWLADCALDGGDDRHPWDALVTLLADARAKTSPETRAAYREQQRQARLSLDAALRAMSTPSSRGEGSSARTDTAGPAAGAPEKVALANLAPPPGMLEYPDEVSAIEAIVNAAECPVPLDSNGDVFIAEWCPTPTSEDPDLRTFQAVPVESLRKQLYGLKYLPSEPRGAKPKSVVDLWFAQPHLRKVGLICSAEDRIIQAQPRALNLWRGLSVDPTPGDVQPMIDAVHHLAGDDADGETYLLRWLAWVVQHPTELPETAIVLKGEQGCGKSYVAGAMRRLFGAHGRIITSSEGLAGKFNARLAGARLVTAEEVSLQKAVDNERVKAIITSTKLDIEFKGRDQLEINNIIALMMLTNSDRALAVTERDRRWAVYDAAPLPYPLTSPEHKALWTQRHEWLRDGGLSHWAHYLSSYPLGDWHPRDRPVVRGLVREADHTRAEGVVGWMQEVEELGVLRTGNEDHHLGDAGGWFPMATLWQAYQDWCRARHKDPGHLVPFGRDISQRWTAERRNITHQGTQRGYLIPRSN